MRLIYDAITGETTFVDEPEIETAQDNSMLIESLKAQLSETDYKIIKCFEFQLAGLPLPYDIVQLHADRQALRNQINALEGE